ncbi:MAG: hypothetical protein WC966_08845 [Bradymonadales bacterium]
MDLFSEKRRATEEEPLTSEVLRNASLVRRLRVLLHAYPLFALSSADSRRDEALRHYDTLSISLKILDIIAERMGMEVEADRELIDFSLQPLLEAMDLRAGLMPDKERHEAITDRVLAALRNDANARRPFKLPYIDIEEGGKVVKRQLEFRLVQDAFSLTGETVMRLTNEAVNLYFNALELDIEDSQAATEAIVHSQLARGKFDEALRSAHYALRQSRMYRDRLARLLRDTQRDIARVDWVIEAPKLIDEAMTHLEERLDVERSIIITTQDRLDQLSPGSSEAAAVARIAEVMQFCIATHTILQRELMSSRTTFLDSQARQAFVPIAYQSRPDLVNEVLTPLLEMNIRTAREALDATVALLVAPLPPALPSLLFLHEGLLRPRTVARKDWFTVEPIQADHFAKDLLKHSPEDREIVENLLKSLQEESLLSELLAYARKQRYTQAQCEIIVLLVLQHFDEESTETPLIHVRHSQKALADPDYYGDDLYISPYSAYEEYSDILF